MAWTRVIKQGSLPVITNANSYLNESDFEAYCLQVGFDLTSYDDEIQQTAVISAAQYINSLGYTGRTYIDGAVMQFPRAGTSDIVPPVVQTAQCWLSVKLLASSNTILYADTASASLKRKTVGSVTKEWFSPEESGKTGVHFDFIDNILRDYLEVTNKIWVGAC